MDKKLHPNIRLNSKNLPSIKRLGLVFFLIFMSFFILPSKVIAENTEVESPLEIDEVLVILYVKNLGTCEIPVAIRGQDAYLPVVDVFNFLKIRTIPGNGFDVVSGFFIDEKNIYQIDKANSLIIYKGKTYSLKPTDIIVTETNLYLKSKFFEQVFGLEAMFNFRTLTISLKSELELPAIREMRLEQMHSNFDRLRGKMKADTTIERTYPLFHFGVADWSVNTTRQWKGNNFARLNLGLGGILAGGEFNSSLLYNANQPFMEKQQYYLWRYADNEKKAFKQVMAGKIATQSVSSIFNPVLGMQITNAPTINRKSFGSYTFSNYTKPNWTVELYVNNILIDYVKADASGFFTFDVPLIYGSTDVTLRYYGPWGEELTSKQSFTIPFNFLPPKELEYRISSGMIQDEKNNLFGQARVNYGLTRAITIGGGLEYNSSITTSQRFSFFNTSVRLGSNLLFSGEYADGIRYKGLLSYNLPTDFQMELYYSKYNAGQKAIRLNFTEERRIMIAKPFRILTFPGLSRFTLSQNLIHHPSTDFPPTKYTIPELSLSGAAGGVSVNITTTAFIINKINSSIFSDASLSTTLLGSILFTPQIRYDYKLNKISLVRYTLEKRFVKYGVVNLSYQHNLITRLTVYQVGFRYDLSYARVGFTAFQTNNTTSISEFASGSFLYQPQLNYRDFNVNANMGRGGLIFIPFLDVNNNGKKDENEPKVIGLNVMLSGGGVQKSNKDTTIVISSLEPYTEHFVEVDANSFENIAWRIKKPKMNIAIEPNKLKLIEIPISVVSEASGTVYIKKTNEEKGLGRILVCFYNSDSVLINKTQTESDGYFSFLGLSPGNCYAKIDSDQLNKLQMVSSPAFIPITIKSNTDGDVVDGLKFILQPKSKGAAKSVPEKQLVSESKRTAELTENKADTEQQKPEILSSPQISDTNKTLLALMVQKRMDSIYQADKQQDLVVKYQQDKDTQTNKQQDLLTEDEQVAEKNTEIQPEQLVKDLQDAKKTDDNQLQLLKSENVFNEKGTYAVQARVHSKLSDARATQAILAEIYKEPVVIVNEGALYKVRINGFADRDEASALIPKLKDQGFAGSFIVSPDKNTGNIIPLDKLTDEKTVAKSVDPLTAKPSLVTLLEILSGKNNSGRLLTPAELARIEETIVNRNPVLKRSKFGDNATYAVQIASHEEALPQKTLATVLQLQTAVESFKDNDGFTKYFSGNHTTYNDAIKTQTDLINKGFKNPFIIVVYKGKIMTVDEYNLDKKQ